MKSTQKQKQKQTENYKTKTHEFIYFNSEKILKNVEKIIEAPGDYSSELGRINSSKAVRGGNDTQLRSSLACSLSSVPSFLSLFLSALRPQAPRFSFYSKKLLITDPIHFYPPR
jgi:hypothetical protein